MLETVRAGSRGALYALATASRLASSRVASYGLALGSLPYDDRTAEEAGVVEETTPPKPERASPAVFCSTLRCEARFSIGRIARKLRRETPLRRGLRPDKNPSQKIQARRGFAWLWIEKSSSNCGAFTKWLQSLRDVTSNTKLPGRRAGRKVGQRACRKVGQRVGHSRFVVRAQAVAGSP